MNSIPRHFWNVLITATTLLVVFLAVLSIKEIKSIAYVGKSDQVVNAISVNGTGDAVAKPDIATFSFGVTETATAVADAQTKASTKLNAALKALKDAGVADNDVKTTSYSINPHYEYQEGICTSAGCPRGRSVLTGYEVSQTVEVKVRVLSKAGPLFQSIGNLGVQNVNGLTFSVDKPDSVKAEARAEAISNAQAKAAELAKELGVTIVRVNSYYDQSDQPVYPYGMGGDTMSLKASVAPVAAPAPDVPKGEQKYTSNVTITYEIR